MEEKLALINQPVIIQKEKKINSKYLIIYKKYKSKIKYKLRKKWNKHGNNLLYLLAIIFIIVQNYYMYKMDFGGLSDNTTLIEISGFKMLLFAEYFLFIVTIILNKKGYI